MRWVVLGLTLVTCAPVRSEAQPSLLVKQDATGTNDGSSWADAFTDLQAALDSAEQSPGTSTEIWVAAGTYKPSKRLNPSDPRSATFQLINGISLYGGFAGNETSREPRAVYLNRTVLSGDLLGDDQPDFVNYSENVFHVVTARNIDEATTLDGFRVVGGYAVSELYREDRGGAMLIETAWPTIRNCVFERNFAGRGTSTVAHSNEGGGAVYITQDIYPAKVRPLVFRDCEFSDNATLGFGGAIFTYDTGLELEHCFFQRNSAAQGGALWSDNSTSLWLQDSNFFDNRALEVSGAVGGVFRQVTIESCGFQRNSAPYGGAASLNATLLVRNSYFQENTAEIEGGALRLSTNQGSAITNSGFYDNTGENGGGINTRSYLSLSDTVFAHNTADSNGGAIYASYAIDAKDCQMRGNMAGEFGGAIFLDYGQMHLSGIDMLDNSANQGGGIALLRGTMRLSDSDVYLNNAYLGGGVLNESGEEVLLERTAIFLNSARFGAGFSHVGGGPTILVNCGIFENIANYYGGGILGGSARLQLRSCTVAGNWAGTRGAGVVAGTDTIITNSVLWGNAVGSSTSSRIDESAQVDGIELAELGHNCIQGWSVSDDPTGNFDLDPLFNAAEDPSADYPDKYELRRESPCVNAGIRETIDPNSWSPPPGQDFDLSGAPRVLCGAVDIGALEHGVVGDLDCDGAFDIDDLSEWAECTRGPDEPGLCLEFDTDGDSDLDLRDLHWLFPGMARP